MRQRTNFSMGMGGNSKWVPSRSSTHLEKQRPNSPQLINFKKRAQFESSLAGMQMKSINVEILCILGVDTSKNVMMRHEKPHNMFLIKKRTENKHMGQEFDQQLQRI
jgi:hypothetical protein